MKDKVYIIYRKINSCIDEVLFFQLISDLDKLDFAKQVVELKAQVKEMEAEAEAKDKPAKDEVKSITHSCRVTHTHSHSHS